MTAMFIIVVIFLPINFVLIVTRIVNYMNLRSTIGLPMTSAFCGILADV